MGCSQSLARTVVSSGLDSIQPPSPGQCLQAFSISKIYIFKMISHQHFRQEIPSSQALQRYSDKHRYKRIKRMNKDSLRAAWYQISPWYGFPSFLDFRFVTVLLTITASDNNKWTQDRTGLGDNDMGLIYLLMTARRAGLVTPARSFNGRLVWQLVWASRNDPASHLFVRNSIINCRYARL